MSGSCTLVCKYTDKTEHLGFHGISEGESTLMIYDRRLNLQNKWNKTF